MINYNWYAGYPITCNAGARISNGDYICILNDDVLVGRDWATSMITTLENDKSIGLVGPRLCYMDNNCNQSMVPTQHPYIEGWCFMLPRSVYESEKCIFDPKIEYAYCEDTELSLRLVNGGYKIKDIPVNIQHLHTQTHKVLRLVGDKEAKNKIYVKNKWKL